MDSTRDDMLDKNYPTITEEQPVQGYPVQNQPYPQNQPNQYNQGNPQGNPQYNNSPNQNNNPQNYQQQYPGPNSQASGPYPQQNYQNQGYPPNMNNQMPPPPPQMGQQQLVVNLPTVITTAHPRYNFILEQCNVPCGVCSFVGGEIVTLVPGCALYSWSACLYICTGFLCFWIPWVVNDCKDIRISCGRCGNVKAIIERPCC